MRLPSTGVAAFATDVLGVEVAPAAVTATIVTSGGAFF